MKVDLHCHSKCSKRPTLWLMQKLGCPESFTEPQMLYQLALRQGMTAVTITDHNSIEGALQIAHLDNVFVSCEYTTYFPEDRCKVHVLAYNITEQQHANLSEARENIFDLVRYLQENGIAHACAHPLYSVNDRLTPAHIEKLILLFKTWEQNGSINPRVNAVLRRLCGQLTREDTDRLAAKHGFLPGFPEPWRKNFIAGSDDHSSLTLASAFTEVPNADTFEDFWAAIEENQGRIACRASSPEMFARNVYGITYQFYQSKFDLDRFRNKDVLLQFLDRMLRSRLEVAEPFLARVHQAIARRRPRRAPAANAPLLNLARFEAEKLIRSDPQLMGFIYDGNAHGADLDQKWFEFVNQVANRVAVHLGGHVLDRVLGARLFDLFHSAGSAGALYALLAPYFASFSLFRHQEAAAREMLRHFDEAGGHSESVAGRVRVAHFTDTFYEVNGVARTLQQQLATAQALGKDYTIVTCPPDRKPCQRGVKQFQPIGSYDLPEYPELKLPCPPFLQMLEYCFEEGVTHIHVATPGPIGLAALAVARILKLPITGTYHTDIPGYAKVFTEDAYIEDLAWRFMLWFYDQLDAVYVPSHATAAELTARGFHTERLRVYPRGVDAEHFHPGKKNGFLHERGYVPKPEAEVERTVNLLYVGRVSKEKNLDDLCKAYRVLLEKGYPARLIVTGDGPYREEMEAALQGTPAVFTGYLDASELPALYASSDLLVFPSTTDTFGNVVLEAQASGIPVIVSNQGGPQENLVPGETGLVVEGKHVEALAGALEELAADHVRRETMGRNARAYAAQRGFRQAFEQLWVMYTGEESNAHGEIGLADFSNMIAEAHLLAS